MGSTFSHPYYPAPREMTLAENVWVVDAITTRIQMYVYSYVDNPETITMGNYPYPAEYNTDLSYPLEVGHGGNPALWDVMFRLNMTVKNTGTKEAKEVVQLYVEFPAIQGMIRR
ncbi:hypothetical protein BGX38DRAFT_1276034 [Terfezia claveryi]|nr:hypothetical protein BGX38DRAFT_1276034 [Terfezia claveryi]